ncbi:putative nuclear localized protein [Senna tora]|uniref:Putative nuclear localized protein n=1 Tax=Senna tora TaxID=362788 RepID=A0A835C837_9FABA|nr:putative nuclear localized protein [Senna tora]
MHRRALGDRSSLEDDAADPLPTQEFIRRVVEIGDESDCDFHSKAWLSALDFLRRRGMVDGNSVAFGTPLSSIKKHANIERVGQVVAVIKSYTPNGLGDLMVTLKDPSSTISASVHRKVFSEGEFGKDMKVGSVLVLQKVAVFSPTRSVCYLNITSRNIVKIFSKDSGPPSELYPTPLRSTVPCIESNENFRTPGNTLSLPQERTKGIISKLTLNATSKEIKDVDKQMGENEVSRSNHSDNGNRNQNRNVVLERESASPRQGRYGSVAKHLEVTPGDDHEIEMKDQSNNPCKLDEGDNPAWNAKNNVSSTNLVDTSESGGLERQVEIPIPKSSIPNWTEEQLDELLAFD